MTNGNARPAPQLGPPNNAWTASATQKASWIARTWVDNGKTYDPDAFYTNATDQHHNYEQQNIKMPGYMKDVMVEIIQEFPLLRTPHDFVRNAVNHAIHHFANETIHLTDHAMKAIEDHATMEETRKERDEVDRHEEMCEEIRELANTFARYRAEDKLMNVEVDLHRKLFMPPTGEPGDMDTYREDVNEGMREDYEYLYDGVCALRDYLADPMTGIKSIPPQPSMFADVQPIPTNIPRKKRA